MRRAADSPPTRVSTRSLDPRERACHLRRATAPRHLSTTRPIHAPEPDEAPAARGAADSDPSGGRPSRPGACRRRRRRGRSTRENASHACRALRSSTPSRRAAPRGVRRRRGRRRRRRGRRRRGRRPSPGRRAGSPSCTPNIRRGGDAAMAPPPPPYGRRRDLPLVADAAPPQPCAPAAAGERAAAGRSRAPAPGAKGRGARRRRRRRRPEAQRRWQRGTEARASPTSRRPDAARRCPWRGTPTWSCSRRCCAVQSTDAEGARAAARPARARRVAKSSGVARGEKAEDRAGVAERREARVMALATAAVRSAPTKGDYSLRSRRREAASSRPRYAWPVARDGAARASPCRAAPRPRIVRPPPLLPVERRVSPSPSPRRGRLEEAALTTTARHASEGSAFVPRAAAPSRSSASAHPAPPVAFVRRQIRTPRDARPRRAARLSSRAPRLGRRPEPDPPARC